jgi:diguanylate cyclase (GGDEF)-like protein/PAS domain S-box-containing protein
MTGILMDNLVYRELLDNLYDGVYFVDLNRIITFWNRSAERITGYSEDEVLGKGCCDNLLAHVDEIGNSLCKSGCPLLATMKDGRRREVNTYLRHKDGHMLPALVKVSAIRNSKGAIIGGIQSFADNSAVMAIRERAADLEKMTLIDPLTGVGNRRYADMSLQNKLSELKRYGWSFGVLFADLDDFKRVNDTFGHEAGDEVLKIVARTMLNNLRSFDFIFRWGGEEFLIIIANVDELQLRTSAERLRIMVQNAGLRLGSKTIRVTVSIGGTLVKTDDSEKSILTRIDDYMYQCKKAGRNRCLIDKFFCTPTTKIIH